MKNEQTNFTFDDFPIGTPVQIACRMQDFYFFRGEKGKVIRNSGKYLGVIVEFDEPREFTDGSIQKSFNFNPTDLKPLAKAKSNFTCGNCGVKGDNQIIYHIAECGL